MTEIALENLQGWVSADWQVETAKTENAATKAAALALGAAQ